VASLQNCIQLFDEVAFDFWLARLCQTDITKVINVIFGSCSGTQNSKHRFTVFVLAVTRAAVVGMRSFIYVNYIAASSSDVAGRITKIRQ
jgi:hypothetical protein